MFFCCPLTITFVPPPPSVAAASSLRGCAPLTSVKENHLSPEQCVIGLNANAKAFSASSFLYMRRLLSLAAGSVYKAIAVWLL